ncbi:YqeG family HAD IIIA-type phosphatase [Lactococcus kimchii]|uniref:YqeG family HAD IIIA-type phosphatase n=1 Tax=Lactococcus sp. S-13 TaxID=2507158 RepID=UPI001023C2E1|nr:YqeG family HAD IIIA-type phosphatase [Lactococcus sp. S-13]RZI49933.1 YqeG family HAD IIIA-type phosphatase [Lactococcus sp. S-13]
MKIDNYKPDFLVEAVYQLHPQRLKDLGIRTVMVDLDNTLIAWNNPDGTPELLAWLSEMRENGLKVIVVSNNKRERVARAVEKFGVEYIWRALKPFSWGIKKALKRFDERPENAVMVGDQLMTDVRAAHRAGVRSILVKPLVESDAWSTQVNRWRERRVWKKIIARDGAPIWKKGL